MQGLTSETRVLVFDDDPYVNASICAMATAYGSGVRSASSISDFLALTTSWNPTHVLVDLIMPGFDGMETLKALATNRNAAKVIVMSGLDKRVLDAAQRFADEMGLEVAGVLSKPFSPASLRKLLTSDPRRHLSRSESGHPNGRTGPSEQDLRSAIQNREISVFYQPKVDCYSEEVIGFEALARWNHPALGFVSPCVFIPLAVETGLIEQLTLAVFDEALSWISSSANERLEIAVNISTLLLTSEALLDLMVQGCKRYGVETNRVILEITETHGMDHPLAALGQLTRYRMKGFQLSIDDFGVGHSSLVQLQRLPFTELKIDKSFIMDAEDSIESQQIAVSVVRLAHSLSMSVTAEGVETPWALNFVREIGCDSAQGYGIAKPMAGCAASRWVESRHAKVN
jgi:EAL domain-containing protein (putative c-di-GMP-specific phosphodiesterase class I)/FixJ family two-component response regulator